MNLEKLTLSNSYHYIRLFQKFKTLFDFWLKHRNTTEISYHINNIWISGICHPTYQTSTITSVAKCHGGVRVVYIFPGPDTATGMSEWQCQLLIPKDDLLTIELIYSGARAVMLTHINMQLLIHNLQRFTIHAYRKRNNCACIHTLLSFIWLYSCRVSVCLV